jgi:hypothetical protein
MRDNEIVIAIELLQLIKNSHKTNSDKIHNEAFKKMLANHDYSINWDTVKELSELSFDWEKAIELIKVGISPNDVRNISRTKDKSKIDRYKELVDYILNNMDFFERRRLKYLCFWKTKRFISFYFKNLLWTLPTTITLIFIILAFTVFRRNTEDLLIGGIGPFILLWYLIFYLYKKIKNDNL